MDEFNIAIPLNTVRVSSNYSIDGHRTMGRHGSVQIEAVQCMTFTAFAVETEETAQATRGTCLRHSRGKRGVEGQEVRCAAAVSEEPNIGLH